MSARAAAERHAQDVVDGNLPRITGDLAGSPLTQMAAIGGLPQPTTMWEILAETPADEASVFAVKYSNGAGDVLELKTVWELFGSGTRIGS